MRFDRRNSLLIASAVLPIAFLAAGEASAQAPAVSAGQAAEDSSPVIVTGVRRPRTVLNSPVPVDVFGEAELKDVAQTDTLNTLQTLIPSFSVPRAANTTSNTFIRAPSLRGLPADKTLLLVNSLRRHKSASVGVAGSGSQSADAAVIPSIGLKSVEVLRDGAAAQYGSDAIAGVINFLLKDADHGGSIEAQAGQYYNGDGDDYLVAGNIGLPLTDKGFVNLSAQWNEGARTIRVNQFKATQFDPFAYAITNPSYLNYVDLREPLQRTGKPEERSIRFLVNSGIDLSDTAKIYAFGNYSWSKGSAAANYRFPGGGNVVLDNPIRLQDGSIFRFNSLYPGGLRPFFMGAVTDWSSAVGIKKSWAFENGQTFDADFSLRYGWDKIDYSIVQTLNPSMGPTSPLDFIASNYVSNETAANADFNYDVPMSFTASPLALSFGAEYRLEKFDIRPGSPTSYQVGTWANPDPFDFCTDQATVAQRTLRATAPQNAGINCASATDPVFNSLSVGSNGITGLPPANSGNFESSSYSIYGEATTDITDWWFIDFAVRGEKYEAFDSKVIGKVATRLKLTDWLGLRGSAGMGFRAPTTGQMNMTQIQINTVNGIPTNTGLFPATNPVSVFLGAKPLKPEESVNYSVGVTANPFSGFSFTLDAYQINLEDTLNATSSITVTTAIKNAMIAAGIPGADSIASVNFFQNAFDSKVEGIDVVSSYTHNWASGQRTSAVWSYNINSYSIEQLKIANLFNTLSVYNFEHNNPQWRSTVTLTHDIDKFSAMLRANIFGPYQRVTTAAPVLFQRYKTEVLWDLEFDYHATKQTTFTVGARNILDTYPPVNVINASNGAIYTDGAVDWQGGFYYGRLAFSF